MSVIAEALKGGSITEILILGIFGFAIFYGVVMIGAEIMDLLSGGR